MAKVLTMYCWMNGRVEFTYGKIPSGALLVIKSKPEEQPLKWRKRMAVKCRLAYDGKTLLIPGIPEANIPAEAAAALVVFQDWLEKCEAKAEGGAV